MRTIQWIISLAFVAAIFTGCETVKGAGKDIENTGQNIQKALTKE